MVYTIDLAESLNYYFALVFVFLCAYWIAFVFKNLSDLLGRLGIVAFVVVMCFFFATIVVITIGIEGTADYYFTGAYAAGFFLRFFRHDH